MGVLDYIRNTMLYEIDYFPVWLESRWWDAIMIQYGQDFKNRDNYKVVIIDCWNKDAAEAMIAHLDSHFWTNKVDLLIATHLHSDHINWFSTLIENLEIWKIAMHQPWNYTNEIKKLSTTNIWAKKLETKIEKSLAWLADISEIAEKEDIEIFEPFAWEQIMEHMWLVWPSKDYYTSLLPSFWNIPVIPNETASLAEKAYKAVKKVINWIKETLDMETESLSDDYEDTSAENNSSMIIYFQPTEDKKFLFTWDAWKEALNKALDGYGKYIENISFLDVPHHWSKRNLGPTILDKLNPKTAYISCPAKWEPKHPSWKVVNALIRRWTDVHVVRWGRKLHHNTWWRWRESSSPEPFHDLVEE